MTSARALAGLLLAAGTTHLARPGFYDPIVPRFLPGDARAWTYGSGLAELCLAAALCVPPLRRRAALSAALFFVAVFPANVQMALDSRHPGGAGVRGNPAIAWGRLPLQVPLVLWALAVARHERRSEQEITRP